MENCKVLVVDDEIDFLETIVKRLQRRKFDVEGVESGPKALELLMKEEFDVVVLDVRMPGMDGIEALREIKRRWPLVEVVILTGHASVNLGIEGMQLGAFDYVMKPANLDDLIAKLQQAYERRLIQQGKIKRAKSEESTERNE